nr:TonB-dependent receptor [Chitinophagaceae bacterium]
MKKKITILLLMISICLIGTQQLKSQSVIQGTIETLDDKPLQFANVLLLKSADSSLVKGVISDTSGKYSFKNNQNGNYLITATFTGMRQVYSQSFEITSDKKAINAGILYLGNGNVQLKDVTVAVKKPMFEQKIDRVVINVKNSVTDAGGTALDVLEKSPGVTVNRQGNLIAINGKNGVVVMINGKITYMPIDAVVQFLAATSADNIEKIELITTPPAKYDAEGNAGYINIVLIHNPYEGISGSYFINAGYGKKELGAAGINFNYRSAKINMYGNYGFKYDHYLQPTTGFTQFTNAGNTIANSSFANRNAIQQVQNVRAGIDYQLDTATIIGVLIGGYISHWKMTANNGATVSKNGVTDTTVSTVNSEVNQWDNLLANLNFQHTFKLGKVIYFDANYIYYKDNNPNTYSNTYYDNAMQFLLQDELKSGK